MACSSPKLIILEDVFMASPRRERECYCNECWINLAQHCTLAHQTNNIWAFCFPLFLPLPLLSGIPDVSLCEPSRHPQTPAWGRARTAHSLACRVPCPLSSPHDSCSGQQYKKVTISYCYWWYYCPTLPFPERQRPPQKSPWPSRPCRSCYGPWERQRSRKQS